MIRSTGCERKGSAMSVPTMDETRPQRWTVYCSNDGEIVGKQRIRADSREAAVEASRYAEYANDLAYSVWAGFKCDCGC